jgi:hypothetical protein
MPHAADSLTAVLVVAERPVDPLDILRPQLERATGDPVDTIIGAHEPLAAIQDALNNRHFDEVILTSHASRLSRWAHVDLRRKVADLDRQIRVLSVDADVRARGVQAPAAA